MRWLRYIPITAMLLIIFISSSTPYEEQTIVPDLMRLLPNAPLFDFLSRFHIPYYGMDISVETRGYYYFLEFLLRKLAHITAFGAIAVSLYIILPRRKWRFPFVIFLTLCFAAIDEFHQYFTAGRSASGQDIALDTFGGLFWLCIVASIRTITRKKTEKKEHDGN